MTSLTGFPDLIYEGAEIVELFCDDGKKNLGINVFVSMDNKISESNHIGIRHTPCKPIAAASRPWYLHIPGRLMNKNARTPPFYDPG